jgi:hypothetical protein
MSKLKSFIRDTAAYDLYNGLRYRLEWLKWVAGKLDRAPHLLKRRLIASRARELRPEVFVETGTLFGDMTYAQRNNFRRLYSIELDDYLFERATRRFRAFPHIRILQGDSGKKITEVLQELDGPCLFWLDAHYSGGITAHGEEMTPVFAEIRHILTHPVKKHVIVIDDARLFNGTDGYPTFRELRDFVDSIDRDCLTWIENDTITVAHTA